MKILMWDERTDEERIIEEKTLWDAVRRYGSRYRFLILEK